MLFTPAHIKPKSFEPRRNSFFLFFIFSSFFFLFFLFLFFVFFVLFFYSGWMRLMFTCVRGR